MSVRPGLGELLQKLQDIAQKKELWRDPQPDSWMWKESPERWQILLLLIADLLMRAQSVPCLLPGGEARLEAVLGAGGGHDSVIGAVRELGALLRRIVSGEVDPRSVFLLDRPGKPGRWSEHRGIATAYWMARAIEPSAPDDVAINAARRAMTTKRPRPLSVATIRKVAQQYRSDALENLVLSAGQDGGRSTDQIARLVDYLQDKSRQGRWDEPLASAFPELLPPVRAHAQLAGSRVSTRPLPGSGKSRRPASAPMENVRAREGGGRGRRVAGPRRNQTSRDE
jgi:hypothetical protein